MIMLIATLPSKNSKNAPATGFTLVELAVVIVVIVILALIVRVAYEAVSSNAYDNSIRSDINNANTVLTQHKLKTGTFPATSGAANGGNGITVSEGNVLAYTRKSYGYCLTITNPEANTTFRFRNIENETVEGNCDPTVTSIAGSTSAAGFADAQGVNARFNRIEGIAVSQSGDIYVSDLNNNRIRKVTQSGDVTTYAGSGAAGCAMGNGTAAVIERPKHIITTPEGDVYAMSCSGSRLLRIDSNRNVTNFAGGSANYCNGTTGSGTGFYWSRGLTRNPRDGSFYVGATELNRICRVTPAGTSTTFAGTGTAGFAEGSGASARFDWPWGVAFDSQGNLYTGDLRNERVRKITPAGVVSTYAGTGTPGFGSGPALTTPLGEIKSLVFDENDVLYMSDFTYSMIRVITPDGQSAPFTNTNGTYVNLPGGAPRVITMDKDGILYAGTFYNVVKIIP